MTRTARLTTPGVLYHVESRLVEGLQLAEEEREAFVTLLGSALASSDWRCVAYCLLSDRLDFAMVTGEGGLESWARRVHGSFSRWLNRRRRRSGPVFATRPSTRDVQREHEANLIANLHNSPVRAGIAHAANAYRWSSHRAYLGFSATPKWLRVGEGLGWVGFATRRSFGNFVDETRDERPLGPVGAHRRALGPVSLVRENPTQPTLESHPVPALLAAVAERCNISIEELRRRYAHGRASRAKRIAIHAAISAGISVARVSAALDVTRQRGFAIGQHPLTADEASITRDIAKAFADLSLAPSLSS